MARPVVQNLEELKALDCATIRPADAAAVLGMDPQSIRVSARAGMLRFDYFFSGPKNTRLHIMRQSFIRYVEGQTT